MKLLFAAFVVYLHLQMIAARASYITGNEDCNYAVLGDSTGVREALDKCLVSDLYHLSFKYVLDEETKESQEFVYHNTDCSGEETKNRGEIATSVKTDSKKTCATYIGLYKYNVYNTTTGEIDRTVDLEIDEPGYDGERSSIVKGSRIRMMSSVFGDCVFGDPPFWTRNLGCRKDEKNGKDVITYEIYRDPQCTDKVEPGVYVYDYTWDNVGIEMAYSRNMREGKPYQFWRRNDTKALFYERVLTDIVCYEQEAVEASTEPSPVIRNNDMHEPRAQNYGDFSKFSEMDFEPKPQPQPRVYDEPQHPLYNGPQAPDYDSNWWTYLAVNVLVSIICTLCVIAICLTAYYYMQNKSDYSPVKWAKEEETDV